MSENAVRDQNFVPSKLAVLNTDTVQGTNLVRIKIDPVTKGVLINQIATISFTMVPIDPQDENYVNCATFMGADGLLYPWVATADGEVLVDMV